MRECEDYHCRCPKYREAHIALQAAGFIAEGYCDHCSCALEDHGKGFRGREQMEADQGRRDVWGQL